MGEEVAALVGVCACLGIVGVLGLGGFLLYTFVFNKDDDGGGGGTTTTPLSEEQPPFQQVGNGTGSGPGSGGGVVPDVPVGLFPEDTVPLPTNNFWSVLASVGSTEWFAPLPFLASRTDQLADGLAMQFCAPDVTTSSTNGVTSDCNNNNRVAIGIANTTLSEPVISEHSTLGVSLRFDGSGGDGSVTFPILHGMPLITLLLISSVPLIIFQQPPTIAFVDATSARVAVADRHWCLWSSETVSWRVNGNGLESSQIENGWIRLGVCNDTATADALASVVGAIPVAASVSLATNSNEEAEIRFNFELLEQTTDPLLMMALPHHAQSLDNPTRNNAIKFDSARGEMFGVEGTTWLVKFNTTDPGFLGELEFSNNEFEIGLRRELHEALIRESSFDPGPPHFADDSADISVNGTNFTWPNDYDIGSNHESPIEAHGHRLYVLSRLILIADQLQETDLRQVMRQRLSQRLSPWFAADTTPFRYDRTWGGLVANLPNLDTYSNHHSLYSNLIYASAVLAKGDAAWGESSYQSVLAFIRDIANPTSSDSHFPVTRVMDWYTGHSWDTGVVDQQRLTASTSANCHAWYAVYLYGVAMNNNDIQQVARILLASEIASAQSYAQIANTTSYESPLSSRIAIGTLGDSFGDLSTQYGSSDSLRVLNQLAPFTPITTTLVSTNWRNTFQNIQWDGNWEALWVAKSAFSDYENAYAISSGVNDYSNATSLADLLWWIAYLSPLQGGGATFPEFQEFMFPDSFCTSRFFQLPVSVKGVAGGERTYASFYFDSEQLVSFNTQPNLNMLILNNETFSFKSQHSFLETETSAIVNAISSLSSGEVAMFATQGTTGVGGFEMEVLNSLGSLGFNHVFTASLGAAWSAVVVVGSQGTAAEAVGDLGDPAVTDSVLYCSSATIPGECQPTSVWATATAQQISLNISGAEYIPEHRQTTDVVGVLMDHLTNKVERIDLITTSSELDSLLVSFNSSDRGAVLVLAAKEGGSALFSATAIASLTELGSTEASNLAATDSFVLIAEKFVAGVSEERQGCPSCLASQHYLDTCVTPSTTPTPAPSPSTAPTPNTGGGGGAAADDDSFTSDTLPIIGIVVGSVFGAAALCFVCVKFNKRRDSSLLYNPSSGPAVALAKEAGGTAGGTADDNNSNSRGNNNNPVGSLELNHNETARDDMNLTQEERDAQRQFNEAKALSDKAITLEQSGEDAAAANSYKEARVILLEILEAKISTDRMEQISIYPVDLLEKVNERLEVL